MSRPRPRRLAATLVLGLAFSQFACASGAQKLVKGGVEGGLEGTLEALNDPRNKKLLKQLLQDKDIQEAAHDLTEAITGGALDGMTEPERQAKLRDATDKFIRTIADSVGKALNEDISPAVTKTVEDVVGGAIGSALRPENKRLASAFIDNVTRSTITAFTQSTATGMRDDLGPAMNKVIAEDLGPAMKKVIEQDLGPALNKMITQDLKPAMEEALGGANGDMVGALSRHITKEIVLGVNDGMKELGISLNPRESQGLGILGWAAIFLALIALILGILLTRIILTRRSLEQERARSERMLLNVLRSIHVDGQTQPIDVDALVARARGQDGDGDPHQESWVASLLTRAKSPYQAATKTDAKPRA
jgi:hypothetical protein